MSRETLPTTRRSREFRRAARVLFGLILALQPGSSNAGEANSTVTVYPTRARLRGPDSMQQLAIEGKNAQGRLIDLSEGAGFSSSDPKVVEVTASGTIQARGDGSAVVSAKAGGVELKVPVTVSDFSAGRPMNFENQVVPIFTKLGCNSGGCHGKASGQNGFRLSLLGFEPMIDYETLVKEGRGRRLFPAAPDRSLLLVKGIATVPHGGGKRMEKDSHEHRVLMRWIAAGMPLGRSDDPKVSRIEVYPNDRAMSRGESRRVIVTAHYTDGSTEDVTHYAQYQSNDTEVADVVEGGRVTARELSGQAAVMARYQGQVAVFRATVPLGKTIDKYPEFASNNVIDQACLKQWRKLDIAPSEPCSDAEFIRRASLDIIGTLPTAAETKSFLASTDPEKRAKLVDSLLDRPEYASYFAVKWADILRNKREGNAMLRRSTFGFHDWIRSALTRNVPYDKFVRAIVTASGSPDDAPQVVWYRKLRAADAFVDDTAQVFLGMRLQCAKCHHHPFEKWGQDDYYGFAAFFAKIGRKNSTTSARDGRVEEAIFTARTGSVSHPKTGKVMEPKGLGGPIVPIPGIVDPRQKLADWMSDPTNPYFASALVNRYWAHFFGRGIVEPMDDLRVTNPPANPELLDGLSNAFIKSGFDLRQLVRTICTSRVYGLSSIPSESNAKDKQSFARHYPKRLGAEVLLDAISQVTGAPTAFSGFPEGTRAIELPDESVGSTFLDTFGRPKRDTPCECERVSDASLGQSLMLLNSTEVQSKLSASSGKAEALSKDPRPDSEKVADLFWAAFGRAPSSGETESALTYLKQRADKRKEAFEDIIWALVNAKEFQFND